MQAATLLTWCTNNYIPCTPKSHGQHHSTPQGKCRHAEQHCYHLKGHTREAALNTVRIQ